MERTELDGIVKMIDKQIDLGLKAITDYQTLQRETNDQYEDRGDWDNLILNALEHIIEQQKSRRELIKEHSSLVTV